MYLKLTSLIHSPLKRCRLQTLLAYPSVPCCTSTASGSCRARICLSSGTAVFLSSSGRSCFSEREETYREEVEPQPLVGMFNEFQYDSLVSVRRLLQNYHIDITLLDLAAWSENQSDYAPRFSRNEFRSLLLPKHLGCHSKRHNFQSSRITRKQTNRGNSSWFNHKYFLSRCSLRLI